MFAHYFSFRRDYVAGLGGQVLAQEFAEGALADKADAGAVFLA